LIDATIGLNHAGGLRLARLAIVALHRGIGITITGSLWLGFGMGTTASQTLFVRLVMRMGLGSFARRIGSIGVSHR